MGDVYYPPGGELFFNYIGKKIAEEAQKLEDETFRLERIKRTMQWKKDIPYFLSVYASAIMIVISFIFIVFLASIVRYAIITESCYHVNYGVCEKSQEFTLQNIIVQSIMFDIVNLNPEQCEHSWIKHYMELQYNKYLVSKTESINVYFDGHKGLQGPPGLPGICFDGPQGPRGVQGVQLV